jgi:hypothetical protein
MPKVKKLGEFKYQYNCTCGKEIILDIGEKPKKLIKCFDCIGKKNEEE